MNSNSNNNEIVGKFGASILLSYSGLVVSYVIHKGLGSDRVLPRRSQLAPVDIAVQMRNNQHDPQELCIRSLLFLCMKNVIVS